MNTLSLGLLGQFNKLLDMLWRLKEKEKINSKQLAYIEQAYFMCRPSGQSAQNNQAKHYSVIQQFIRHLLYDLLDSVEVGRLAELFSMLPWQTEEKFIIKELVVLICQQAKFSQFPKIAILLKTLKAQHGKKDFVTMVVDQVFEEIIRAMERNDFKESQRRLGVAKFISEAYNYKLLHTDTLFDVLYKFINYDIELKVPDVYLQSLDENPVDSFRIRFVCTVLDSLGQYFWKGERRTRMDRFLLWFQRYIHMKAYVLMDLEFMILDTFDKIRPNPFFKRFDSLEQVEEACLQIEAFEQRSFKTGRVVDAKTGREYQGSLNLLSDIDALRYDELVDRLAYAEDEAAAEKKNDKPKKKYQQKQKRNEEEAGHGDRSDSESGGGGSVSYNDDVKVSKKEMEKMKSQMQQQYALIDKELDKREIDNFETEFSNMLQIESTAARKDLKKRHQDIVLPVSEIKKKLPQPPEEQKAMDPPSGAPRIMPKGMIPFALMTRKGKHTKLERIQLPEESKMVHNTLQRIA